MINFVPYLSVSGVNEFWHICWWFYLNSEKKVGDDIDFSLLFCKGILLSSLYEKIREILGADFFLTNKYFFKNILLDSCNSLRLKIV